MRKKLLKLFFLFGLIVCYAIVLAACDLINCSDDESKHEHIFSIEWTYDDTNHWHVATCGHNEISDIFNHQWDEGLITTQPTTTTDGIKTYTCIICGATKVETINKIHVCNFTELNISEEYLAREATCEYPSEYYYSCLCGEHGEETFEYGPILEHSYGEWIIVSEATSDYSGLKQRGCLFCNHVIQQEIRQEQLFNQPIDFSFLITTAKDELFILESIQIINVAVEGVENCDELSYKIVKSNSQENVWEVFGHDTIIDKNGNRTECDGYLNGNMYKVILPEDISFVDYNDKELTFTIEVGNKQVMKASAGVKFLRTLENNSVGYYPYLIKPSDTEDYVDLILSKIENLNTEDVLVLGEITSFEEIEEYSKTGNYNELEQILIGKIESIDDNKNGTYTVKLVQPELDKVFDELDINYHDNVEIPDDEKTIDKFKTSAVNQLVENDSFITFLVAVNKTTENYATERDLVAKPLSKTDFKDMVHIEPNVKIQGLGAKLTLNGYIGNGNSGGIELKTKQGKTIGFIKVSFTIETLVSFDLNVVYKLRYFWCIPTGVDYFDISIEQNDSFSFNFDVEINIDYDLKDTDQSEKVYYYNNKTGEVHIGSCLHLKNADLSLGQWEQINYSTMIKICSNKDGTANEHECEHCKPYTRLNGAAFIYNKATKTIHTCNCVYIKQMNYENTYIHYGTYSTFPKHIYTIENKCDWCQPEKADSRKFEEDLLSTLRYSDWSGKVSEIKEWISESNIKPYESDGKTICSIKSVIGFLTVNIDIKYVLSFDLNAKLEIKYSQSHNNVYGARICNGVVDCYSTHKESSSGPTLSLVGDVEFNTGIEVDAYVSVIGLSRWIQVGIYAQSGIYVDTEGIVYLTANKNENSYAAARLEAGLYLNVGLYYKLLFWDGRDSILDTKLPLLTLGYDKAYFAYVNPIDYIEFGDEYSLNANKILNVLYYDVKSQKTNEAVLSLNGNALYSVQLSLKDGRYCYIKDGKIIAKDNAPDEFDDELIISVSGATSWNKYKAGSSAFFLGDERIAIHYVSEKKEQTDNPSMTIEDMLKQPHEEIAGYKFCGYFVDEDLTERAYIEFPSIPENYYPKYQPDSEQLFLRTPFTMQQVVYGRSYYDVVEKYSYLSKLDDLWHYNNAHQEQRHLLFNDDSISAMDLFIKKDADLHFNSFYDYHDTLEFEYKFSSGGGVTSVPLNRDIYWTAYYGDAKITNNGIVYYIVDDEYAVIIGVNNSITTNEFEFPNTIEGKPVKEISIYADVDSEFDIHINNLVIPKTVENVVIIFPNIYKTKIDGIIFGEGVKTIQLFGGIYKDISIPSTAYYFNYQPFIYGNLFYEILNEQNIKVNGGEHYFTYDGCLYSKEGDLVYQFGNKTDLELHIKDGTKRVLRRSMTGINKNIYIPNSVEYFDEFFNEYSLRYEMTVNGSFIEEKSPVFFTSNMQFIKKYLGCMLELGNHYYVFNSPEDLNYIEYYVNQPTFGRSFLIMGDNVNKIELYNYMVDMLYQEISDGDASIEEIRQIIDNFNSIRQIRISNGTIYFTGWDSITEKNVEKILTYLPNSTDKLEEKIKDLDDVFRDYYAYLESFSHSHEFYSDEWFYDETYHWHECIVEGCDNVIEKAEHHYVNGVCICGKIEGFITPISVITSIGELECCSNGDVNEIFSPTEKELIGTWEVDGKLIIISVFGQFGSITKMPFIFSENMLYVYTAESETVLYEMLLDEGKGELREIKFLDNGKVVIIYKDEDQIYASLLLDYIQYGNLLIITSNGEISLILKINDDSSLSIYADSHENEIDKYVGTYYLDHIDVTALGIQSTKTYYLGEKYFYVEELRADLIWIDINEGRTASITVEGNEYSARTFAIENTLYGVFAEPVAIFGAANDELISYIKADVEDDVIIIGTQNSVNSFRYYLKLLSDD